jgi:hypothetical protein
MPTQEKAMRTRWVSKLAVAGVASIMLMFANDNASLTDANSLVTSAQARIGRPLTPLSGAGVARRTTRRALGYGALGAGAVYGYRGYYGAGCIRGPYGGVVCR